MNDPNEKPSLAQRYIDVCDERDQINRNYQAEIADHHKAVDELRLAKGASDFHRVQNEVLTKCIKELRLKLKHRWDSEMDALRLEDLKRAKGEPIGQAEHDVKAGDPVDVIRDQTFARERADLRREREERFGKPTTTPTFGPHFLKTIKLTIDTDALKRKARDRWDVDRMKCNQSYEMLGAWLSMLAGTEPMSDPWLDLVGQIMLIEDHMVKETYMPGSHRTLFSMPTRTPTSKSTHSRPDMPVDDLSFGEAVQCRGEWLSLFVMAERGSAERYYWVRQIVFLEDTMMSKGQLLGSKRTSFQVDEDAGGRIEPRLSEILKAEGWPGGSGVNVGPPTPKPDTSNWPPREKP